MSSSIPWYIRILTFFGASIAGGLFLLFLAALDLLNSSSSSILIGLVFLFGTTAASRIAQNEESICLEPILVSFVNIGQGLFVFGISESIREDFTSILLLVFIIQLVLFIVFQSGVQKFLSIPIGFASLTGILYQLKLNLYFPILLYIAAVLLYFVLDRYSKKKRNNEPISLHLSVGKDALVITFIANLISPYIEDFLGYEFRIPFVSSLLIHSICIVLLWKELYARLGLKKEFIFGFYLFFFLILYPTINSPGIIGGIFILFLGFAYSVKSVQIWGILSLIGFIIYYYYNLQVTLLAKSYQLLGTGALFLSAYYIWQFRLPKKEA
ncbi:DUF4401 domain-containing protein [Leptospira ilyithenensis]|uniref:DUF4401 domain-containing protein n=1 Tax=Leptospira ilyithenensis TaxID=2484901 RepID=A0A4V3JWX4_9LEPT|nr:DUF4401 domain-containing protein [Leptospira ilyithenensis]TGN09425.1 DUF4401 domain-containing protein [Leptospira ilyithenensis]